MHNRRKGRKAINFNINLKNLTLLLFSNKQAQALNIPFTNINLKNLFSSSASQSIPIENANSDYSITLNHKEASTFLESSRNNFPIHNDIDYSLILDKDQSQNSINTASSDHRIRRKRANSKLFEEWGGGNFQNECIDEMCSYEELKETGEYSESEALQKWGLLVNRCMFMQPFCNAMNTIKCINRWNDRQCVCREGFEGDSCDDVILDLFWWDLRLQRVIVNFRAER